MNASRRPMRLAIEGVLRRALVSASLLVAMTSELARAQAVPISRDQLESSDHATRMRAFYEQLSAANTDVPREVGIGQRTDRLAAQARSQPELSTALIAMLEKENVLIKTAAVGSLTETDTEYYANLIACVAALRDARAARALVGAIRTGSMATDGISALGEAALPELRTAINSRDWSARASAMQALGSLASRHSEPRLGDATLAEIRVTLLRALSDSEPWVRRAAIGSLRTFPDTAVHAAVQGVATSDPHFVVRDGRQVYPVRDAASAWLREHRR